MGVKSEWPLDYAAGCNAAERVVLTLQWHMD
jgi:hypothetical protein